MSKTNQTDTPDDQRRDILKAGAALLGAGGLATLGIGFGSDSALAAEAKLTASDVTLDTNAGQLVELYVAPDMNYDWDGLEAEPARIDFYVDAKLQNAASGSGGDYEEIGSEGQTISTSSLEGSGSYSFGDTKSVLNHSNISDADFEPSGDGNSKSTDVAVRVRAVLTDVNGKTYSDPDGASFTVTVNDQTGKVDAGGSANTGGTGR